MQSNDYRLVTKLYKNTGSPRKVKTAKPKTQNIFISAALVLIFLNALGFPGSYTRVFGDSFGVLIEYTSFLLQIMIMIFSSGKSVMQIRLINLKPNYRGIYLMFAVISTCSMIATNDRGEEIVSCIRICVTALFAIWLCENLTVEELLERLFYAQILFLLASIAFPIVFAEYDWRGASYKTMFVGISSVKNVAATELSFAIIMMTVLFRIKLENKKRLSLIFIAVYILNFIMLIRTEGTGALLTAIAISVYVLLIDKILGKRLPIGIIFISGTVLFLIVALTIIPVFEPFFNALGKDATLTGRIPLWRQLIAVMKNNNTWMGFGFGMFWRDNESLGLFHAGFAKNSWSANMSSGAHNMLLEFWANTGLIGVAMLFIAVLFSFRHVKNKNLVSNEQYLFSTGYMLFYMVCGWTEKILTTYEYDILFLCLAMAMCCVGWKPKTETKYIVKKWPISKYTYVIGSNSRNAYDKHSEV